MASTLGSLLHSGATTAREPVVEGKDQYRPRDDSFTQCTLRCQRPIPTAGYTAVGLAVMACLFLPFGGIALAASRSVVEMSVRYDNDASCGGGGYSNVEREAQLMEMQGEGLSCELEMNVPADMEPPVYVYYELRNFYQNHRRFVKSRSETQLRGDNGTAVHGLMGYLSFDDSTTYLDKCAPVQYATDGGVVDPCGLGKWEGCLYLKSERDAASAWQVAWSYFNDTYTLRRNGVIDLPVDSHQISFVTDRTKRFGAYEPENFNDDDATRGGGTITGKVNEDEHFMIWMRPAALPRFRKLFGRINTKLHKGDVVTLEVLNRYNTYRFNGEKHFVLSTTSWLGGKNDLMGWLYIIMGVFCTCMAVLFGTLHYMPPRPFADDRFMSWERPHRVC